MPKTITVANKKGGPGKTTILFTLASLAAAAGKRVLIVDLDPDGYGGFAFDCDLQQKGSACLLDPDLGEAVFQQVTPPGAGEPFPNLHVLVGNNDMDAAAIGRLDPEALRDALEDLDYDVVFVDVPSGNQRLIRLGMVAADKLIIPTYAHPFAIESAGRLIEDVERRMSLKRPGPTKFCLVANMVDERRRLDRELEPVLKQRHPNVPLFRIDQDHALHKAVTARTPITIADPDFPSKPQFQALLKWALN